MPYTENPNTGSVLTHQLHLHLVKLNNFVEPQSIMQCIEDGKRALAPNEMHKACFECERTSSRGSAERRMNRPRSVLKPLRPRWTHKYRGEICNMSLFVHLLEDGMSDEPERTRQSSGWTHIPHLLHLCCKLPTPVTAYCEDSPQREGLSVKTHNP